MSITRTPSPVKEFRTQLHMTQPEFAAACGTSKMLIIRAEQCCYKMPPPAIENLLVSRISGFDLGEFRRNYAAYQLAQRQFSYGILDTQFDFSTVSPAKHPFIAWRDYSSINQTQVCKFWCLHPAIIYKFEVQPHLLNDLPSDLVDALLESGYNEKILNELRAAYKGHKAYLASLISVNTVGVNVADR